MSPAIGGGLVLVTGGTGFLGGAVVRCLQREGYPARSFQRGRPTDTTAAVTGDVRDPGAVHAAVRGAEAVIHAAGLAHVFRDADRAPFAEINEGGTDVVARAAVAAGVSHFVLVSSVAVHGDPGGRPLGAYAISKAGAEARAIAALSGSPVRLTILRVATLYGEGDRGNVQRLLEAIARGRFVWIGRGTNRKTLLHVDDAARACVLPLARTGQPPLAGPGRGVEVYDVGAPAVTMRAVVEGLARALGHGVPSWHVPPALALALAGVTKAVSPRRGRRLSQALARWLSDDVYAAEPFARRFGFEPRVTLAGGLERQVAWWRGSRAATPPC